MTIDINDLKIGGKVLVEATVTYICEEGGVIVNLKNLDHSIVAHNTANIHSILPREPQVDEVWLDRSTNTAFMIMCTSNDSFVCKCNNGKLFIGVLSEVVKRFKFVPTEQHKEYGFE